MKRSSVCQRVGYILDNESPRKHVEEKFLSLDPHLLGDSAQGYLLFNLREVEGQEEVLEDEDDEEEEESEVDEKVNQVRENAQLVHATR